MFDVGVVVVVTVDGEVSSMTRGDEHRDSKNFEANLPFFSKRFGDGIFFSAMGVLFLFRGFLPPSFPGRAAEWHQQCRRARTVTVSVRVTPSSTELNQKVAIQKIIYFQDEFFFLNCH